MCQVFLRRRLAELDLQTLDRLLDQFSDQLWRSRKGGVFDLYVAEGSFHVGVEETEDVLYDCEGELLKLDLLPEDAPQRISMSAGLDNDHAYETLDRLGRLIADAFDGTRTPPIK